MEKHWGQAWCTLWKHFYQERFGSFITWLWKNVGVLMLFCTSKEESVNCSYWTRHRNEGKEQILLEHVCVSASTTHDPDPCTTRAEVSCCYGTVYTIDKPKMWSQWKCQQMPAPLTDLWNCSLAKYSCWELDSLSADVLSWARMCPLWLRANSDPYREILVWLRAGGTGRQVQGELGCKLSGRWQGNCSSMNMLLKMYATLESVLKYISDSRNTELRYMYCFLKQNYFCLHCIDPLWNKTLHLLFISSAE